MNIKSQLQHGMINSNYKMGHVLYSKLRWVCHKKT